MYNRTRTHFKHHEPRRTVGSMVLMERQIRWIGNRNRSEVIRELIDNAMAREEAQSVGSDECLRERKLNVI